MTVLSPQQMLKRTGDYLANMEKAKRKHVAVGLPAEKVGGKIYGDGMSIVEVGAIHEYGAGDNPRRSFLRVPFQIKRAELDEGIVQQFRDVAEHGKDADRALGLIGTIAVNIIKGAFTSRGYGEWPDIQQSTKNAKGSSQVLIDSGTLRRSNTYVVRS